LKANPRKYKRFFISICGCITIGVLVTSCSAVNAAIPSSSETAAAVSEEPRAKVNIAKSADINGMPLTDYKDCYTQDGYGDDQSMVYFYVTVSRGPQGTDTDHAFNEVQEYQNDVEIYKQIPAPMAEALVQEGDAEGPAPGMFGYAAIIPNATISVHGYTSTQVPYEKSFKLALTDPAGRWREQSNITLIKSVWDPIRCRNKLSYDLIRNIPDMVSTRTQFARLFIKDTTAGSDQFVDYGFYTQVEAINKRYLKNHGLDSTGQLYKAKFFEFNRYPDNIRTIDDPQFNLAMFEDILAVKGSDDHSKLISMLDDVNNYAMDINEVINKHFNMDNYITWLAFNILVGNEDITTQNFYLYSPTNSDKWYFIPWDLDGAFDTVYRGMQFRQGKYAQGLTNIWGVVLHRRFLTYPENRALLDQKITELKNAYLAPEIINAKIQSYEPLITDEYKKMPDFYHLGISLNTHNEMLAKTSNEIDICYNTYKESLTWPMPFYIGEIQYEDDGNGMQLQWTPSFSLNGEKITYNIVIALTPDLGLYVHKKNGLSTPAFNFEDLRPGLYYYYVEAENESGNTMPAFDYYSVNNTTYYGIRRALIKDDGTIISDYQFGEAEVQLFQNNYDNFIKSLPQNEVNADQ